MKRLIYYKRLFAYRQRQSASERIVYSFLVYNAICERDDVWDKETGKYNQDVMQSIDDYIQIPIYFLNERHDVKVNALAKQLGLGKATISRIIEKFKTNGIILHGRYIRHDGIYKDGYFTLSTNEKFVFWNARRRGSLRSIGSRRIIVMRARSLAIALW